MWGNFMALDTGDTIGPYQVVSQLGQGGMATVYKAYHPQLDRYVAIKLMHPAFLNDPNFSMRFRREAQVIAKLEHTNIIPVYDYSEFEGEPYLVMKFIDGDTLKNALSEKMLSFRQTIDILATVASALTYAHELGILHRDVKPSNILLDANKTPYLTDFGLARMMQAGQSTLSQDMLVGTPHYMSPEQAKGNRELGPGTDIYSLGVMYYEVAVGRLPFSGDTPYAIVHDHIYTPLPLPSQVNASVSPAVEQVLLKALAKDPAERYSSAVELAQAFNRAIGETDFQPGAAPATRTRLPQPTRAMREKPVSATKQPPRKHKTGWLIGGTGVVAALLVAAFLLVNRPTSTTTQTPLPTLASLTTPVPTAAPANTLESATIRLYTVPDMTSDQAQAAIQQKPDEALNYLALANALWKQNDLQGARTAIEQGFRAADDKITYLLTAAASADTLGKTSGAVQLNVQALNLAQNNAAIYPAVRAMVGEYLYKTALHPAALKPGDTRRSSAADDTGIGAIMVARGLISENRLPLAAAALNRLSVEDSALPEAHLVQGELDLAQGNKQKALTQWKQVAAMTDAPGWVKQRANELIQSNSGV
jgi:serine/threonine protein kinase